MGIKRTPTGSDDEDFEVADYEMLTEESSQSSDDNSSVEDFVVEVRHGEVHRIRFQDEQDRRSNFFFY